MSPKKGKKKASSKPSALDVSELEEGEIRDDDDVTAAPSTVATTTATPGKPSKKSKPSRPSKPSPTELKQGWEFVEKAEVEEGEIVDDDDQGAGDELIVDALQAATAATVAGMLAAGSQPYFPFFLLAVVIHTLAPFVGTHVAVLFCFSCSSPS